MSGKLVRRKTPEQHHLDFFVKARDGRKRSYVFDFGKAYRCDHPEMRIIARGGNMYRCVECNYSFQWPGAIMWPLHFTVIQGAFQILQFAKEFGGYALQEVLRRPIGQVDGSPHKPVLPEGMSFMDVVKALEEIETTREDGGAAQLKNLLAELWEKPALPVGEGETADVAD